MPEPGGSAAAASVVGVLHPVGPLPAAVYWRRRALVLSLLLAVLGGGGWLGVVLVTGQDDSNVTSAAATRTAAVRTSAPSRPVPDEGSARTSPRRSAADAAATTTARPTTARPTTAAPVAGGPCTDDMLAVTVAAPETVRIGGKPTFELRVGNRSTVPCVRDLDKELQELVLLDAAGRRIWGSNDCFPEQSDDRRTLAPGEIVAFPVLWGGLTSEPKCAGSRQEPAPGTYVLRGRLHTTTSADASIQLTR